MTDPVLDFAQVMTEALSEPAKPSDPEDRTTDGVLKAMLTENTGRHMLDSGGAYGRHFERNQHVDFDAQPDAVSDWRWGYADIRVSLYHALREQLDYLPEADALFERWATTGDRAREPWLPLAEVFAEDIGGQGFYSDGPPTVVNTYNHETLLSQDIQYVLFTLEDETPISDYLDLERTDDEEADPVVLGPGTYVLLQTHNGCDARGGYTQARLFEVTSYDDAEFLTIGQDATVACGACDARWWTHEATHFEPAEEAGEDRELHEYGWVNLSDPKEFARWTARNIVRDVMFNRGHPEAAPPVLGIGHYSYPSTDQRGFCPNCGVGELSAYAH